MSKVSGSQLDQSGAVRNVEEGTKFTPKFDSHGNLPAVVSDSKSGEVLMLAWMNEEALSRTLQTGNVHFYSRSRQKIWMKGEESGNILRVEEVRTDCDQDAVWLKVRVDGPGAACHTGRRTCFYRAVAKTSSPPTNGLGDLKFVVSDKAFDPEAVYGKREVSEQ